VAGHGGDEGSYKSAGLEDFGHGHGKFDRGCKKKYAPLARVFGWL
jgi:hypothetical protein